MINQAAANLAPDNETANPISFEITTGEQESQHKLYKAILEDLSAAKKYEASSDDTTYTRPNIKDILPVIKPHSPWARESLSALQEWEGYVVSISKDTFTARLTDLTGHCTTEGEEADFPIDDLMDADRSKLSKGGIFRWVIGYRRSPGGTKDRLSRIVFRNLPAWTEKEIEKNRQKAAEWASQLHVE